MYTCQIISIVGVTIINKNIRNHQKSPNPIPDKLFKPSTNIKLATKYNISTKFKKQELYEKINNYLLIN